MKIQRTTHTSGTAAAGRAGQARGFGMLWAWIIRLAPFLHSRRHSLAEDAAAFFRLPLFGEILARQTGQTAWHIPMLAGDCANGAHRSGLTYGASVFRVSDPRRFRFQSFCNGSAAFCKALKRGVASVTQFLAGQWFGMVRLLGPNAFVPAAAPPLVF